MTSLLQFILSLLRDPEFKQEFRDDPAGTLEKHGLEGLCGQDVADVLPLVVDNSRVSLDRSYETGNNHVMVVPPPPSPHPMPGEPGLHSVVRQFDYITNTYVYNDSHDTVLDNSVNQNIWAYGDVFQKFDNDPVVASGDGAVAAGDDVDDVNTGDIDADDGAAVAVGGNATGSNDDNSTQANVHNFGSGEVAVAGTGGTATQNDSDSHDDIGSHNDVDVDIASNNDVNSHNDIDSHNTTTTTTTTTATANSNNQIDSHDDIGSHNDVDVASHNDVNSNNDLSTHTDVASHNDTLVIAP
ncbi:IniB N-terminal domain-containing protein [Actinosynnema sp. ALI-1.44]|uniref:IniB N-terminal domain-containing protein n=1 Tax=Actinosynnema sp. ALI-1.44 TaxID=1933779 RepID=UPI001EDC19EF|nr:IniB N-terminal domain-containing protein [Actinosynnema sp. ALI-1.44]